MNRLSLNDIEDGSRVISCKNGGNGTLSALRKLRHDRNMCNVIIKIKGEEIWAHRNILVINSPYFHGMFSEGFSEAVAREITLSEESIDATSAKRLIDFMYSGNLTVEANTVQGFIMVADLWEMPEVKKLCEDFMEQLIDHSNCIGIVKFGQMYRSQCLVDRAQSMLKQRFPLVASGPEFTQLSPLELHNILAASHLSLGDEGEDVIVKALFRWLDHHTELSPEEYPPLLRDVHWNRVSFSCRQRYTQHPLVEKSPELQQLIQSLIDDKNRGQRQVQTTLYVFGGFLQSRTGPKCPRLPNVERLDPNTNHWKPCADLPLLSSSAVAFNLYGHIFYCGCEPVPVAGSNAVVTQTQIFEYSAMHNDWRSADKIFPLHIVNHLDSLLQAEGALAVCQQSGAVFLVSSAEMATFSVTVINGDLVCGSVHLLPRPHSYIPPQQKNHAATVMERRLYVTGGDRHDSGADPVPTARVMAFDIDLKEWTLCADMLEPRVKHAVVVYEGKLYANGGFNIRRLNTMECYDPRANQWTFLTPMYNNRSHHQLLVRHNEIWALGGKSYVETRVGARKVLSGCEKYKHDINEWEQYGHFNMKYARCSFPAVAL